MSTSHESDDHGTGKSAMRVANAVEALAPSVVGLATRRRGFAAGAVWKRGMVVTTASANGHAQEVQSIRPDAKAVAGSLLATIFPATDIDSTQAKFVRHAYAEPTNVLIASDVCLVPKRLGSGLRHMGPVFHTRSSWKARVFETALNASAKSSTQLALSPA